MVTFFVGDEGRGLAVCLFAFTVAVLTVIAAGLFAAEGGGGKGEGRGGEGRGRMYIKYNKLQQSQQITYVVRVSSHQLLTEEKACSTLGKVAQPGATLDREPPQHTLSPPYLSLAGL